MIAHSFDGEVFGPARRLHGATYVVDVEFRAEQLGDDDIVVDIGRAGSALKDVLGALNFQNLDDIAEFSGRNTSTEFMARIIHDRISQKIASGDLGPGSHQLASLRVVLHESHIAWAAYEASLSDPR
jgi:6-pyruvoyl-tetrahydropterin synthase